MRPHPTSPTETPKGSRRSHPPGAGRPSRVSPRTSPRRRSPGGARSSADVEVDDVAARGRRDGRRSGRPRRGRRSSRTQACAPSSVYPPPWPPELGLGTDPHRGREHVPADPFRSRRAAEGLRDHGEVDVIPERWVEDDVNVGRVEGHCIVAPGLGRRPRPPAGRVADRETVERRFEPLRERAQAGGGRRLVRGSARAPSGSRRRPDARDPRSPKPNTRAFDPSASAIARRILPVLNARGRVRELRSVGRPVRVSPVGDHLCEAGAVGGEGVGGHIVPDRDPVARRRPREAAYVTVAHRSSRWPGSGARRCRRHPSPTPDGCGLPIRRRTRSGSRLARRSALHPSPPLSRSRSGRPPSASTPYSA